ncbi:NAD-dependent epimerase/dehydratase, partial [Dillenia turbinata]
MPEYCVTGGTGLIGAYLVKHLLERGDTVRTTVRNPDDAAKVGFLWEMKGAKERLQIMKAENLVEGSYDEAIKGVNGVFHTASPVAPPPNSNIQATYPAILASETLIDPCLKGTLNVLSSCLKASTVKRVVLTSSSATIRYCDNIQELSPLNESYWSDPEYCKQNNLWYAYAKTLAEKEAFHAAKESGIDLVVVNPGFVVGPLLTPKPTSSLILLLNIIKGSLGWYPNSTVGFVHIDDVVMAHLLAMDKKEAEGRFICSNTTDHWSKIIEMLKTKYPSYPFED